MTSFGCGSNGDNVPQSFDCWSSCNFQGKMCVGGMAGSNCIVIEAVRENGM